jgi:DNA-binding winged helix-turn-helix (wHTH) protein
MLPAVSVMITVGPTRAMRRGKRAVTLERPTTESSSSAGAKNRRRWHFAGSVLDERSLELVVNGVNAELERKPLEVLIYLLQHAGEVCTKDELLAGVWPGRVLSETVLTKSIGRLREVLGDRDQDIIKTAYGFGYRFVAPVQVELASAAPPARFDYRAGDHPPPGPYGLSSSASASAGTVKPGAAATKRPVRSASSSSRSMRHHSGPSSARSRSFASSTTRWATRPGW